MSNVMIDTQTASTIQQSLEDRKFLLQQDEERERRLNYLIRSDDMQREHIEIFLRVAVKGARSGNWLCMRQYLHYYCEQESKYRLGPLASFMEEHHIEIQGGNPYNKLETDLFTELYQLCRASILAYPEKYDSIVDDPKLSNNDKFFHITHLKRNVKMCLETHDWLIGLGQSRQETAA